MSQTEKPKRKTGRPPKFPGEGTRVSHSLRVRGTIDKALRQAADANNRTIAEELEFRINQSFEGMWLNIGTPFKQTLLDMAAHNLRSVEDELSGMVANATTVASTKLGAMTSGELAEYIRSELGPAARRAVESEYEFWAKNGPVQQGEKMDRDADFFENMMRRMAWSTQVDNAIRSLASIVDPASRAIEDNRISDYYASIYNDIQEKIIEGVKVDDPEVTATSTKRSRKRS